MSRNKKFYAVVAGKKPGIYTEWYGDQGAEIQVRGFSGALFKGFATREAAQHFLNQNVSEVLKGKSKAQDRKKSKPGFKAGPAPTIKNPKKSSVTIYTDGGCLNNPGPGGYGVVIKTGKQIKEVSGGFRLTTNNRMELMACIAGLSELEKPSSVILFSDSKYVVDGITKDWAARWRSNGWMRNKKEKAINPDLWGRLLDLCDRHDVEFRWIKGHAGNEGNERCDRLANSEAAKSGLPVDKIYENSIKL